jgi:hypothetical protein
MALQAFKKWEDSNGLWFFGQAGAGKTFASEVCDKIIDNAFIIDGDEVRKLISFDLGFSKSDREIQIKRVLGLAEIAIKNNRLPIVSTVTMSVGVHRRCQQLGINVVNIVRPVDQLHKVREIYATQSNVVGKDLKEYASETVKLYNNGTAEFEARIKDFVK